MIPSPSLETRCISVWSQAILKVLLPKLPYWHPFSHFTCQPNPTRRTTQLQLWTFKESIPEASTECPSRHHILRAGNAKQQGKSPLQQHCQRTLRWQIAMDSRIVGSKYGTVHGAAFEKELSVQDVQYLFRG